MGTFACCSSVFKRNKMAFDTAIAFVSTVFSFSRTAVSVLHALMLITAVVAIVNIRPFYNKMVHYTYLLSTTFLLFTTAVVFYAHRNIEPTDPLDAPTGTRYKSTEAWVVMLCLPVFALIPTLHVLMQVADTFRNIFSE